MFIYNITLKVDHAILNEWLHWQKEIHIPEIMATGLFYDHRFYRLLEHDEEEGNTYVIQFLAKEKNDYNRYLENFAPRLRKESDQKWGDQVLSFRTLLQDLK